MLNVYYVQESKKNKMDASARTYLAKYPGQWWRSVICQVDSKGLFGRQTFNNGMLHRVACQQGQRTIGTRKYIHTCMYIPVFLYTHALHDADMYRDVERGIKLMIWKINNF